MLNIGYLMVYFWKMLIGYMRVSKHDGSQNLDLQKDALIEAGVDKNRIYYDMASGKNDDWELRRLLDYRSKGYNNNVSR